MAIVIDLDLRSDGWDMLKGFNKRSRAERAQLCGENLLRVNAAL